jgi:hypothetical protein
MARGTLLEAEDATSGLKTKAEAWELERQCRHVRNLL